MLTGAPDSVRHSNKTKVAKLSYCRIVALSGASMQQNDNMTLCIYRTMVLSNCRPQQCDNTTTQQCASMALWCHRIVAPDNATIRQHDSGDNTTVHVCRIITLSGATMR